MRPFEIFTSLFDKVPFFQKKRYGAEIVDDSPNTLSKNKVYIIDEGGGADSLMFLCPCGCNDTITLNLLTDASPHWVYKIIHNRVSIYPSINRRVGCRSHFWIRHGKIKWHRDYW